MQCIIQFQYRIMLQTDNAFTVFFLVRAVLSQRKKLKNLLEVARGGELFTVGEFAQKREGETRVGVEKTHRVGIDLRDLFPFQPFPFL